ncbi:mitochondrial 2-oxoglutarate/malate carrier protein [Apis mellifera caucasica]|uniref:Mitochondrial 2-oxoglutarate/malate carrier protein n=1 Tax=Apis mellifera TaxID=7460 RepID=A0A7M7RB38_APIME|nr:mitochondrial 2-oxoglutarate/malate carrier protein [Apis mellifera]KAG6799781.1 mitochondrial 2-oxoglutarate/malate carrier protein [Apis mellifera caucasica]KAG9428829.1 mitochondrial 2-oxoglutarate/malate carrier protein [Apis mellifera carnica]|eukprot:XP_624399.2 mitochondrial 2-oxoglutarate/malate carrier protein [Apis mellifera]
MSNQKTVSTSINFLFGGTAGMAATCVVQPLDLIKNRMQLSGIKISTINIISSILKNEGILAFYSGLSAGLLRQASYTTTRLGTFEWLSELISKDRQPNFLMKLLIGSSAGCVGAFVGTPAEVALIRMTADGRLPLAERRNYKNAFNALFRIAKEEGFLALWRGTVPTMGRAMVVNAAQLASYSQSKETLLNTGYFEDNILLHFTSSMISGLVTTIASMPVDIAKTRIQNMKIVDGKPEFKGAIDVIIQVCRNEGVFSLWKGFFPYYARLGPHTVLTFIFLEQIRNFYKTYSV